MTTLADRTAPNRFARGTILGAAALTIMAPAIIAPSTERAYSNSRRRFATKLAMLPRAVHRR